MKKAEEKRWKKFVNAMCVLALMREYHNNVPVVLKMRNDCIEMHIHVPTGSDDEKEVLNDIFEYVEADAKARAHPSVVDYLTYIYINWEGDGHDK